MINHPNIVQIYGYFELEGKLAIVYQDIKEGSLYDWLYEKNHKFKFSEKVWIFMQISKTL